MTNAQRISEEVVALLKLPAPDPTRLSKAATDYATATREVNARLAQIGEILDGGDERQALLIAESPPPVMDDADALCFHQLARWREICVAEGLPAAPPIKANVVHRLNSLYAKGVTGDHRIFKDFRAAVMSRDDEKALSLARAIEKLSPNDKNATKERLRLEEKVFQLRVAKLEKSIEVEDPGLVEQALAEVLEFGARGDDGVPPAVGKANELLRGERAKTAMARCRSWIGQIGTTVTSKQWQVVGDILARIDESVREHGLVFTPEMQIEIENGRVFFNQERAKFLETTAFNASLRELQAQAETIESQTQMPGVRPLSHLSELLTNLNRCWQKVNSFGREVDGAIIQRVSKQVDTLRTEIARRQKNRLISIIAGVSVSIVFLAALGWYLLGLYRANEVAAEISSGIAANQISVVEQLIAAANKDGLTKFSAGLQGRLEEGQTWLAGRKSEALAALDQLEALETSALENFKNQDVVAIHARFGELMQSIEAMPKEKQVDLLPRAAKIRSSLQDWAKSLGLAVADEIQDDIDAFETGVGAKLREKQSISSFEENLSQAEKIISGLDQKLASTAPGFALPPALQASFDSHRDMIIQSRKHASTLRDNLAAMRAVKDLSEFNSLVAASADSPLVQINEIQALRAITRQKFDQDALMADLMFPWNPLAWRAFLKGEEASRLHPEETLQVEDNFFGRIFNDPFTQSIYQADITGRPNRRIYTKGSGLFADVRDELDPSTYNMRRVKTFTGSMFDPAVDGAVIGFKMRTLTSSASNANDVATAADNIVPSAPSGIFARMQLDGFYKDGRPILSIWEILDRATSAEKYSPLYLGFVAQNFGMINDARPFAWGAHFAPSGFELFRKIRLATGGASIRSGSWLDPESEKATETKLKPLFSEPSNFLKEALVNRSLARSAKAAGGNMLYAGYVGADGMPVLAPTVPLADSLWGFSGSPPEQKSSLLFKLAVEGDTESKYERTAAAQPFSPLFYFPGDRKQIFSTAEREASLTPDLLERIQLPPLFRDMPIKQGVSP